MTLHTERCFSVLNIAKDSRKADYDSMVKMRYYGMKEKFGV